MPPRTPSIPIPGDDAASLRASVMAIREVLLGMGLAGSVGEGVLAGVAPPLVARDPKAAMELTTKQYVDAAVAIVTAAAVLGEANTNSNSGAGAGIVLAKVGVDLPLKSFTAGAGIALTPSSTELAIAVAFSAAIHGNLTGGSLHALAVAAGAAGFLSGADKTKLNGLPSAPIMASDVEALQVGTPTYDDLQDFLNMAWSGGQFTGGEVTDGGSETVDCAAMTGMIRDADSVTSNTLFFDIVADNLAIPTDTTRFVRINYNAGTPIWELSAIEDTGRENIIHMAKVTNDGGVLHISSLVDHAGNIPNRFSHVLKSVFGVRRADNLGGIMLGEGGTRYITVSAGQIFYGEHGNDFTAKDTDPGGGADTFDTEYFNGSVWVTTTGVSQWPNTQYNNIASGLVTMTNNRWAVLWFYAETDDHLSMIYGSAQYVTQALAELETVPTSIPDKLFEHGLLIGRLIFKKSAASADVESAFVQAFVPTTVISHIELPDLTTGDAGHTQLHTDAKALTWLADGGAEGGQPVSLWEQIKTGFNLNGGGTISMSAGSLFKWTARFIAISNGRGAHFSTAGFFDIIMPGGGILVGVGGASDRTWVAAGIVLNLWEALYYILPIGSAQTSLLANFRVAFYQSDLEVPADWILLAVRNGDDGIVKVGTGIHLGVGESRTNNSINAKVDGIETGAEVNNISDANATDLTDGGETALHSHVGDAAAGWALLAGPFTDSGAISRTFTVSSYPGYQDLLLTVRGLIPGTDDRMALLQLNGDTGANYEWGSVQHGNGVAQYQRGQGGVTSLAAGDTGAGGAFGTGTGEIANISFEFPGFQLTSGYHQVPYDWAARVAFASQMRASGDGEWASAAAITSIKFLMEASATYSAVLALYGRVNT